MMAMAFTMSASAQRYVSEVFNGAQIVLTPNVPFGTNIDFLTSDFSNPSIYGPEVVQLQTDVTTQQPIPPAFFDPTNGTTAVKVTQLTMDVYQPHPYIDCETARPVFIYVHTGNLLPPPINGSPTGTKMDSSAVETCKQMAKRGYVAVDMDYRLGWNPLGSTVEIRRGTLLNAVYRSIHDLKQCVRALKADAAGPNTYGIDPDKITVYGEGTGGYIALAAATLDHPSELFIEKFRPDPFDLNTSYIDTLTVGNIEGFNGALCLYRPNGFDSGFDFCVNGGGALADTSWLAPGDMPMVAFHGVFDPFAPFTDGVVIVPTTGEQVLELQGSNLFIQLANTYGNNASFADLPDGDPYTDRARSLYGTDQVHGSNSVHINTGTEGLYPLVTPNWPAQIPGTFEEAGPWQWWDPNSTLAQTEVAPGITANDASLASNPNMSAEKGRAYIDTIMGYMNPRIVAALGLENCAVTATDCEGVVAGNALPGNPCDDGDPGTQNDVYSTDCVCMGTVVGIDEIEAFAGLRMAPNPMRDDLSISAKGVIRMVEVFDVNGRRVRAENVENTSYILHRKGLRQGAYFITFTFDQGTVTRKLMLD
jgi:hypothetical protein